MSNINQAISKINGNYPEKILQFGAGNFLRAFVDWMIDEANDSGDYKGSIVLCQPSSRSNEMTKLFQQQDGIYTLAMRGIEDNKAVEKEKVITSVSRCINAYDNFEQLIEIAKSADLEVVISNTTEAGIVYKQGDKFTDSPPSSFPAKVCILLHERFKAFKGDIHKGLLFLPTELIDHNGMELQRIILQYANEWELGDEFINWLNQANKFTNTMVDRIVTGYPRDQVAYFEEKLGYEDNLLVTSELFNLWVIEGEKEWADILPIHKGKANVLWTNDVTPYKMRKVKILNGGHTATVLAAYLAGHDVVLDFMQDELFKEYLKQLLFDEVIPTIDLPDEELRTFAEAVFDRFANPYIKHKLLDISLNSGSKFYARCIPTLLTYHNEKGYLPKILTFSLAAFIQFYKGEKIDAGYVGTRADNTVYPIKDEPEVIDFFAAVWKSGDITKITHEVLANDKLWGGNDLNQVEGLEEMISEYLSEMQTTPIANIIKDLLQEA